MAKPVRELEVATLADALRPTFRMCSGLAFLRLLRPDDPSERVPALVWTTALFVGGAALRSAVDVRPRSRARIVGVEVDGRRIGVLSDIQSRNMLPLVQAVEASGRLAVVRAEVDGMVLIPQVVVSCQTADEVPTGWWATNGVEVPCGGAGAASVDVDADADREGRPQSDDTARFAPPSTPQADPRGE